MNPSSNLDSHPILDTPDKLCHEILLGVGPLESHGSQRLLLYGETLLLRSHEII